MCLIAVSWQEHPAYPLVVAANRDEFYRRPSLPADYWPDAPAVLAGRDEEQGGSWLGVTQTGRFAAVTNARGAAAGRQQAPSRGHLIRDFLTGSQSARDYMEDCHTRIADYAGCNLLCADAEGLFYLTNHPQPELRRLPGGLYVLSNGHMDDEWPKMQRLRQALEAQITEGKLSTDALLERLLDRTLAPRASLPDTGIGQLLERQLSSVFIQLPGYGTRCSTALIASADQSLQFHERRYDKRGRAAGDSRFTLTWPRIEEPHAQAL